MGGDEPLGTFAWGSAAVLSGAGFEGAEVQPQPDADALEVPAPYSPLEPLGEGGMGVVVAVWDPRFERRLALKLMRPGLLGQAAARQRFARETRMTAGLAHPGIVAVHDLGELPDGRMWFTMKEVRGQTLAVLMPRGAPPALHALRRLVGLLVRVGEALAYAHSRGIVHRDIKPQNIMVGEFGEVLVLDWGLARHVHTAEPRPAQDASPQAASSELTQAGAVLGTPRYMAPEQARGEVVGCAADVWALGCMLHQVLSGSTRRELDALGGAPPALRSACLRALSPDPADRFSEAGEMTAALQAWLDGSADRLRAEAIVSRARAMLPQIHAQQAEARQRDDAAQQALADLPITAPIDQKRPHWAALDRAAALRKEAAVQTALFLQTARSALELSPELPSAHALLAEHYRARVVEADAARDPLQIARFEEHLRAHDRTGEHAAFLAGTGAVSLQTDPSGAEVSARRYAQVDRRLEAGSPEPLGRTPLAGVPLGAGSWLLELRAPGRQVVRYPVLIQRGTPWAPAEPVWMPPEGLHPDCAYVPAGGFWAGGDPDAGDALSRRWVELPGFFIQRAPVTVAAYQRFLNALVASGRAEEAERWAPRRNTGGAVGLRPGADGRYALFSATGEPDWSLEMPVVSVSWHAARAYAAWMRDETGVGWRLPRELEWEKAARGVDGRFWPWGDHIDPAWCHYADAIGDRWHLLPAGGHPGDISPYGVRDTAGNTRDWCADAWTVSGSLDASGRLLPVPPHAELRMLRGGGVTSSVRMTRSAARFVAAEGYTLGMLGFRLVCEGRSRIVW